MTSRVGRFFLSKFMFFILLFVLGLYFLVSIDTKRVTRLEEEKGVKFSFFQKVWESISMPRLKLGIDLRGGTYLIVGVEIEKAIENRLQGESKALDQLFKRNKFKDLPSKKEVSNLSLIMDFSDEESAKVCYNFINKEILSLKSTRKGTQIISVLTPAEDQRIRIGSVEQAVNVLSTRLGGLVF